MIDIRIFDPPDGAWLRLERRYAVWHRMRSRRRAACGTDLRDAAFWTLAPSRYDHDHDRCWRCDPR